MKKKDETLREKLLCYAQEIAEKNGIGAINMRLLAKKEQQPEPFITTFQVKMRFFLH